MPRKDGSIGRRGSAFVVIVMCVAILSACAVQAAASTPDPAFAQFVVGTWTYEGPYQYGGTLYPDEYRLYTFESGTTAWISTGEDGSQCAYRFAAADVIRIDCGAGGRELRAVSVPREGESLLIQELDGRLSPLGERLRFERVPGG